MRTVTTIAGLMLASGLMTGEVFAQANLSDATVCRRALNADRTGWVDGSDYAAEAIKRGLTFRACDEMMDDDPAAVKDNKSGQATNEVDDIEHPTFMRAALFFLLGKETSIKFQSDGATEESRQIFRNGRYSSVEVWYWPMKDLGPCKIAGRMLGPPFKMMLADFNAMPSPRAAKFGLMGYGEKMAQLVFPTDTYCFAQGEAITSKKPSAPIAGTIKCDLGIDLTNNVYRRLKALDYIRANFCPGQPEPPPAPPEKRKPY